MRKLLSILTIAFIAIVFSCAKPEPPRPDCELKNYGSVTVKNSTGYNVWVDVTWGNVSVNYEKLLYRGNTYKYSEIPAGGIEIWVSFDDNNWQFEYENLSACEDMIYTWYLVGKGIDSGLSLDISTSDGTVIKTLTKFEQSSK